jgi:alpha-beta hydrolase superfamily lysophospholipase
LRPLRLAWFYCLGLIHMGCVFEMQRAPQQDTALESTTGNSKSNPSMSTRPNLPFPTLGGRQLWADRHWFAGWRVQQHAWTGHARLLDSNNVRQAWGSLAACEAALQAAREERGLTLRSDRVVVLVHGLGRSRASMSKLAAALEAQGIAVLDMGYPSTRRSLQEHAAQLEGLLDHLAADGARQVDFVTHSLGGIVVRSALGRAGAWREQLQIGRLAMLAPPSQGSSFAQALKDFVPFRMVMGEVGPQLARDEAGAVPAPDCRFGVVAAQRGDGGGWNPLLQGADDGVVTVEETKLEGMEDFLLVHGTHTFVMDKPEVVAAVLQYLETGDFGAPSIDG